MLSEDKRERMRRSYHLEKKSLRQIAREEHCSRETVKKTVFDRLQKSYQLTQPKPTFVFGQPFQARFESHFCTPSAGWEKGQVEHIRGGV